MALSPHPPPLPPSLLGQAVRRSVRRAAETHCGTRWACTGFTDLAGRAAHPCGIFQGRPFSVFAKLSTAADAAAQFTAELAGLRLLHDLAGVAVPVPVADGVLAVPPGRQLLLFEALPERPPTARGPADWRSIGRALATLHAVPGTRFGLATSNYFGPVPQDNTPVHPDSWAAFYAERRLAPHLRRATDSGYLPAAWPPGSAGSSAGCLRWLVRSHAQPCCTATPSSTTSSAPRPVRCWWMPRPISATPSSIWRCSATSTRYPRTFRRLRRAEADRPRIPGAPRAVAAVRLSGRAVSDGWNAIRTAVPGPHRPGGNQLPVSTAHQPGPDTR